ncbi:hypothetical protein LZG71_25725 [Dyadobacter sp. CY312]|nr:hypothetical protein [Dyadobacter sp. CY312]
MLDQFGLINMNGRMYDPVLGRMLSPDNYVQEPGMTQSFNRYTYAMNNPLVYTDPDGNNPFIGALIGAASYTLGVAFSKGGFKNWNWLSFAGSVVVGAITSGFATELGGALSQAKNLSVLAKGAIQVGAYSAWGGTMSAMTGGDFLSGAISGAVGSGMATLVGGFTTNSFAQVGSASLAGGGSAELAGGDFWRGAATAGIVAGFNHAAHSLEDMASTRLQKRILADGRLTIGEANEWYRKGGGRDLILDASKLDLGWVNDQGWVDGVKIVQTLYKSGDGLVHGQMTMRRIDGQHATIDRGEYNFEQIGKYTDNFFRNTFTKIGLAAATNFGALSGKSYWIYYQGRALINQYKPYSPY